VSEADWTVPVEVHAVCRLTGVLLRSSLDAGNSQCNGIATSAEKRYRNSTEADARIPVTMATSLNSQLLIAATGGEQCGNHPLASFSCLNLPGGNCDTGKGTKCVANSNTVQSFSSSDCGGPPWIATRSLHNPRVSSHRYTHIDSIHDVALVPSVLVVSLAVITKCSESMSTCCLLEVH
jgi:hypothetical protein